MSNHQEFLADIRSIEPTVESLDDAFFYAMTSVDRQLYQGEAFFLGQIEKGVFFSGHDLDCCRWLPNTNLIEAIGILSTEFEEEVLDLFRR